VTSAANWTFSALELWAHVSQVSGQAGTTQVTVTVDPAPTGEARDATLTIISAGHTVTYVVHQDGKSPVEIWIDTFRSFIPKLLETLARLIAQISLML